jgi:hypothetical protein
MAEKLSNIAKILVNDPNFIKTIEGHLESIMKDGKVDAYDIPKIMAIVTGSYNNLKKNKLTYEELPDVLAEIVDYIFTKHDLVPDDQEEKFKDMINSVTSLIMLQPKVKKGCIKFLNFIMCKKSIKNNEE